MNKVLKSFAKKVWQMSKDVIQETFRNVFDHRDVADNIEKLGDFAKEQKETFDKNQEELQQRIQDMSIPFQGLSTDEPLIIGDDIERESETNINLEELIPGCNIANEKVFELLRVGDEQKIDLVRTVRFDLMRKEGCVTKEKLKQDLHRLKVPHQQIFDSLRQEKAQLRAKTVVDDALSSPQDGPVVD